MLTFPLVPCRRAPGTLFRASQFLAEELPIRLAHRVQELDSLPDGLNDMPSVRRVKDWYAQSFEVRCALCPHCLPPDPTYQLYESPHFNT